MQDYDELKRKAEQLIGREAAKELEQRLKKRTQPYAVVDVDNASMTAAAQSGSSETDAPDKSRSTSTARGTEPPPGPPGGDRSGTERLLALAISREYAYSMLGLVLGLACIIAGTILGLHGVAGSTSWTAKVLGLESNINDAAPGVVLFVVGVFYVWITRPKVRLKNIRG